MYKRKSFAKYTSNPRCIVRPEMQLQLKYVTQQFIFNVKFFKLIYKIDNRDLTTDCKIIPTPESKNNFL